VSIMNSEKVSFIVLGGQMLWSRNDHKLTFHRLTSMMAHVWASFWYGTLGVMMTNYYTEGSV